jgi:antitoxin (DNA-binding transcriptional repressor) of toxin-antitoxin stability system
MLLVYYTGMIRINVHEAKTHLSYYLAKVKKKGETIIVCNRNQPIAEIRALPSPLAGKRPIGLAKGQFSVPPAFFEPLPNDVLDAFSGKAT